MAMEARLGCVLDSREFFLAQINELCQQQKDFCLESIRRTVALTDLSLDKPSAKRRKGSYFPKSTGKENCFEIIGKENCFPDSNIKVGGTRLNTPKKVVLAKVCAVKADGGDSQEHVIVKQKGNEDLGRSTEGKEHFQQKGNDHLGHTTDGQVDGDIFTSAADPGRSTEGREHFQQKGNDHLGHTTDGQVDGDIFTSAAAIHTGSVGEDLVAPLPLVEPSNLVKREVPLARGKPSKRRKEAAQPAAPVATTRMTRARAKVLENAGGNTAIAEEEPPPKKPRGRYANAKAISRSLAETYGNAGEAEPSADVHFMKQEQDRSEAAKLDGGEAIEAHTLVDEQSRETWPAEKSRASSGNARSGLSPHVETEGDLGRSNATAIVPSSAEEQDMEEPVENRTAIVSHISMEERVEEGPQSKKSRTPQGNAIAHSSSPATTDGNSGKFELVLAESGNVLSSAAEKDTRETANLEDVHGIVRHTGDAQSFVDEHSRDGPAPKKDPDGMKSIQTRKSMVLQLSGNTLGLRLSQTSTEVLRIDMADRESMILSRDVDEGEVHRSRESALEGLIAFECNGRKELLEQLPPEEDADRGCGLSPLENDEERTTPTTGAQRLQNELAEQEADTIVLHSPEVKAVEKNYMAGTSAEEHVGHEDCPSPETSSALKGIGRPISYLLTEIGKVADQTEKIVAHTAHRHSSTVNQDTKETGNLEGMEVVVAENVALHSSLEKEVQKGIPFVLVDSVLEVSPLGIFFHLDRTSPSRNQGKLHRRPDAASDFHEKEGADRGLVTSPPREGHPLSTSSTMPQEHGEGLVEQVAHLKIKISSLLENAAVEQIGEEPGPTESRGHDGNARAISRSPEKVDEQPRKAEEIAVQTVYECSSVDEQDREERTGDLVNLELDLVHDTDVYRSVEKQDGRKTCKRRKCTSLVEDGNQLELRDLLISNPISPISPVISKDHDDGNEVMGVIQDVHGSVEPALRCLEDVMLCGGNFLPHGLSDKEGCTANPGNADEELIQPTATPRCTGEWLSEKQAETMVSNSTELETNHSPEHISDHHLPHRLFDKEGFTSNAANAGEELIQQIATPRGTGEWLSGKQGETMLSNSTEMETNHRPENISDHHLPHLLSDKEGCTSNPVNAGEELRQPTATPRGTGECLSDKQGETMVSNSTELETNHSPENIADSHLAHQVTWMNHADSFPSPAYLYPGKIDCQGAAKTCHLEKGTPVDYCRLYANVGCRSESRVERLKFQTFAERYGLEQPFADPVGDAENDFEKKGLELGRGIGREWSTCSKLRDKELQIDEAVSFLRIPQTAEVCPHIVNDVCGASPDCQQHRRMKGSSDEVAEVGRISEPCSSKDFQASGLSEECNTIKPGSICSIEQVLEVPSLERSSQEGGGPVLDISGPTVRSVHLQNQGGSISNVVIPQIQTSNLISGMKTFVPVLQPPLPAVLQSGKRDIKVKALEAAEAAKRMQEKRELERREKFRKKAQDNGRCAVEKERPKDEAGTVQKETVEASMPAAEIPKDRILSSDCSNSKLLFSPASCVKRGIAAKLRSEQEKSRKEEEEIRRKEDEKKKKGAKLAADKQKKEELEKDREEKRKRRENVLKQRKEQEDRLRAELEEKERRHRALEEAERERKAAEEEIKKQRRAERNRERELRQKEELEAKAARLAEKEAERNRREEAILANKLAEEKEQKQAEGAPAVRTISKGPGQQLRGLSGDISASHSLRTRPFAAAPVPKATPTRQTGMVATPGFQKGSQSTSMSRVLSGSMSGGPTHLTHVRIQHHVATDAKNGKYDTSISCIETLSLDAADSDTVGPMSYEISPFRASSDDEDEEEQPVKPQKHVPFWARKDNLQPQLLQQLMQDPDEIFSGSKTCSLKDVFGTTGSKKVQDFSKRSGSGDWVEDRVSWREELQYKIQMGFMK